MVIMLVNIQVKPEHIDDFIKISKFNQENTVKEAGNIRFDVLQDTGDSAHFTLYEVYENDEATAFHKTTEHYKKWNEEMKEYMAVPRSKILYQAAAFTK